MILDDLAAEEEHLMGQIKHATRRAQLEQAGVFTRYHRVHEAYALLLPEAGSGMEALKRALFLQWYGWLEPPYISGLLSVDADCQWRVMHRLDQVVGHGELDRELACMLAWYYSITEWFFDEGAGLPTVGDYLGRSHSVLDQGKGFSALQAYLRATHPPLTLAMAFSPTTLRCRGAMGAYFLQMLRAGQRQDG
jgi:hypothetical protein